jgi:hypothetical protein
LIVFVSVFSGGKSEEKTVRCEAWSGWYSANYPWITCDFRNVFFTQDTNLTIERIGHPELADEAFNTITFTSSSISLVHRDILAKFPNLVRVTVFAGSELKNQDCLENCMNIKHLTLSLGDLAGISRHTFTDCRNLETISLSSNSLADLLEGLFINQHYLQNLELAGKNMKLRVISLEGLQSLSRLSLAEMDLNQVEENFFHELNIKRLEYEGDFQRTFAFPIGLLESQETLEELFIYSADFSLVPGDLGAILGTLKLKTLGLVDAGIPTAEPFVDLLNIERIDLSSNRIEELPDNSFKGCPKLTHLNLAYNPIASLGDNSFNLLSGLKELDLTDTQLTSIAPNIFHPLITLEVLNMFSSFAGDELIIKKELFMHSTNLKELDLFGNKITAIHPESFDNLKRLSRLSLRANKCVDREFFVPQNEILDMEMVKRELGACFRN